MRRLRPSPAICVALLALFIALGGTTYAVTALPRNSVGTPQLRSRAVTEDKLATDAIVTAKLANGAVRANKIAPGSIVGSRIASNALGGDQIDEATLGTVPKAQESERTALAARATVADRVERIDQVARADTAALADRATRADHADRTDRTGVAESLAAVDTNVERANLDPGAGRRLKVLCDPGLVRVSGGVIQTDGAITAEVLESGPTFDGWLVTVVNTGSDPITIEASVICIRAGRS